jgi:hypothetical protein
LYADERRVVDYAKWTTDELVRLQGLANAEGAEPEEKAAIASELQRRQSAPAPAFPAAQTANPVEAASDLPVEDDADDLVARRDLNKKILTGVAFVLIAVIGIWGGSALLSSDASSGGDSSGGSLEKHSRDYVAQASACEAGAEIALQPVEDASDFDIADNVTQARDVCEQARTNLLDMSTDHFDDEATEIWNGVDRMKSGLNAFLTYMGDQSPAKLVEAKNKLVAGKGAIEDGVSKINSIRAEQGLTAL